MTHTFMRAYPSDFQLESKSRTLTGRLVPYDIAADVLDRLEAGQVEVYKEGFRRGAFSAQVGDPGRVKTIALYHTHSRDGLGFLGPFVGLREGDDGLWGDVRVVPTKVEDVASLLESGVNELSIEFGLRRGENTAVDDAGVRWRTAVHLHGVALEAKGAYSGAAVMAYRAELDEQQREEIERKAAEDAAAKRAAEVEEARRSADAAADERRRRWKELEAETAAKAEQQAALVAKYGS